MTYTITPPDSDPGDVQDLLAQVAEVERSQLSEDVDGFLALFDADAVWVSAGGVRLVGRETIAEGTRKVLPGAFADGSVRYRVAHVRFITPDIALTNIDQEYLTSTGEALIPRQEGRPSYIWARRDGRWLIASGQNTPVPA